MKDVEKLPVGWVSGDITAICPTCHLGANTFEIVVSIYLVYQCVCNQRFTLIIAELTNEEQADMEAKKNQIGMGF